MHCSAACTWAAPSLPQASAPRSTRSPNWHPTYWYPDTAPAGEHNTPSPPRYPTAGSKAAAAPATSSPLPYLTWHLLAAEAETPASPRAGLASLNLRMISRNLPGLIGGEPCGVSHENVVYVIRTTSMVRLRHVT